MEEEGTTDTKRRSRTLQEQNGSDTLPLSKTEATEHKKREGNRQLTTRRVTMAQRKVERERQPDYKEMTLDREGKDPEERLHKGGTPKRKAPRDQ